MTILTQKRTDPNEYRNKYKALPFMRDGSLRNLFGNGAAAHHKPLVSRQPKEILPYVLSFDPAVMHFLRDFVRDANAEIKPDVDDEGFTRNGVHSDFSRLMCPAGFMMNPMSYVALDNSDYIKHLGLKPDLDADEIAIGEELWDIIFSEYFPSPIKVTKRSAGGARRNTSDHQWKQDYGEYVLQPEVLERILTLHAKGDWKTLANEFEMVFMMYAQKRDQVDSVGKAREVMSLLYALGKEDDAHGITNADKRVVIDGVEWEGFSATRARFIHAGPWAVNVILSMIGTGTLQSLFHRFPKVFHVNTDEQICAVLNGNHIWAGDVKEYDRSMKREYIELPHRVMSRYWDPRLAEMSLHLYFSSYYARPLDMNGTKGTLVGDITSFEPQVVCGNRSGHALTSLIAKGNKVWETLYVMHKAGFPVKGHVRRYLDAIMPIGLVNNGDDEVIYSKDKGLLDKFLSKRLDVKQGAFAVSREDGMVYSGKVLRLTDTPLVYEPTPRLATAFEKIYVPERSIGGLFRAHWDIGVTERINARSLHPAGDAAWSIHDFYYRKHLEPRFGSLASMLLNAAANKPLPVGNLTSAELEVVDDPRKLYYKYKDGEIRDDIIALSTINVPVEAFMHSVKAYYNGIIH